MAFEHLERLIKLQEAQRLRRSGAGLKFSALAPDDRIPPSRDAAESETFQWYEGRLRSLRLRLLPDLPWMEHQLHLEFPWMEPLTKSLMRQMHLSLVGDGTVHISPTLIIGPPGSGKTRYARRFAELTRLPFRRVNVGGSNSSMIITGSARGWATARPSVIIDVLVDQCIANPMIVFEELDKDAENGPNGRLSDAILQLAESENAKCWYDQYLLINCDLSRVNYLATANSASTVSSPLLQRFEQVQVGLPEREHYPDLVHGVLKEVCLTWGIDSRQLPVLEDFEWNHLMKHANNPRHLVRAAKAVLGIKARTWSSALH